MSEDEGFRSQRVRLDPQAVRRTLRSAGLRARHGLSQNFLADVDVLDRILDEAAPTTGDVVLEVGPGLGILTGGLLSAGASVVAIELDRGLVGWLRDRFADALERGVADPGAPGALRLVSGDALDVDVSELVTPPYSVVANLPYHITSPVLHRLLAEWPRPRRAVLMLQREVAERIAAPPGGMSYLSVFVQYHARVRLAFLVPAASFEPEPAVESAVVVLEPYGAFGSHEPHGAPGSNSETEVRGDGAAPGKRLDPDRENALWRLVQAAFRERRKMLHNVLVRQLPVSADRVALALGAAGVAPERRPQTVSVEEWLAILDALGPIGSDQRGRRTDSLAADSLGADSLAADPPQADSDFGGAEPGAVSSEPSSPLTRRPPASTPPMPKPLRPMLPPTGAPRSPAGPRR